jgi:Tol biopolymer transport system component
MYKASTTSDGYEVQALPDVINSSKSEGDPFISPDEDYLIFRGYTNSLGRGDLYISYRINEKWTEPENLGEPINSMHHEMCPYVTPDGKYFIFASSRINEDYDAIAGENLQELRSKHHSPDNGQLNIYYISADFISEGRRKFE